MSGKDKQKPKEASEIKTSKPSLLREITEKTKKVKEKARRQLTIARTKSELSHLKEQITGISKPDVFSFSIEETRKLENAFGSRFSRMDKATIAYNIRMLTVDKLEEAENKLPGSGARLFAILEKDGKEEPVPLGYKFKEKDKLKIHFRKNDEAENSYGMRHLFKNQPEIRKVKIKQTSSRGKGREGIATRKGLDGNFYFPDGSYAPIFTGTEIKIVQVFTKDQLEKYKKNSVAYDTGEGNKRYITPKEAKDIHRYYGIVPPPTQKDKKQNREYWRTVDATDYSQSSGSKKRRILTELKYIPRNERERMFISKWREIMRTNSPQQLIEMRDEIAIMSPDDPIVIIPGEIAGMRLRYGAALRYALFKRYAEIKGHRVSLTSSYRSTKSQERLWYRGLARRIRKYHRLYPNKSPREIRKMALAENRRWVAYPGKSHHNTGGAVDIRISNLPMRKYRGSKRDYERAMKTGDLSGIKNKKDRKALETVLYMNRELKASYFLGTNYFHETWHWNIDKKDGRTIYRNI